MVIKLGIEIKIITTVEMKWSVIVFFFKAAKTPKAIPRGTEMITDQILILTVVGSLDKMIAITSTLG